MGTDPLLLGGGGGGGGGEGGLQNLTFGRQLCVHIKMYHTRYLECNWSGIGTYIHFCVGIGS